MTPSKDSVRFNSTLEPSTNKLWGAHLRVPNRRAKGLIDGTSRRVVCGLNGSVEYQCALVPFGHGVFVITVNKRLCRSLGLEFGMKVRVALRKDESRYGLPLPEEFREVIHQDTDGSALFHALTRGRQRTLLYIIGSAKSPGKRIARALTVVRHLKANRGKINYKQLNVALRDPRRVVPR